MASRPIWNGHLKLSLVSCAISMFSATTQSEKISFNLLNAGTGHRLRQQYVDEETREVVEREDRIKGYNLGDDTYITVTEEEFDQVEIASTHMIDIERFVDASEIDRVYFDDCYFVAPDDEVGADAFAVIRDAMRDRAVVGIGRIVMFRRERPILIEPRGKGILATTLRYHYEVKDDRPYLATVESRKASDEMVDLAGYIIDKKHGAFDPSTFEDRYQNALAELIEAKQAGKAPARTGRAEKPPAVVNLLEALRDSVARETSGISPPRRSSGTKAQRTPRSGARPAPKAPKPGRKAS